MNTVDKYKELCARRDALNVKLATLAGIRKAHEARMYESGFSSVEDIKKFLEQKRLEKEAKELEYKKLLVEFEKEIVSIEKALEEVRGYAI